MENLKKAMIIRNGNVVGAVGDKNFSTAPIGTVLAYAGNEVPRGYLLADGASYPTAEYPDLYAVIGNTYGGDSVNFNVPDYRETVLVGVGVNTTDIDAIVSHDVYGLGEFKDDQFQGHWHNLGNSNGVDTVALGASEKGSSTRGAMSDSSATRYVVDTALDAITDGTNGEPRVGATTHGKQKGVTYIIKAFHTNEGVDSGVSDDVVEYVDEKIASELSGKVYTSLAELGLTADATLDDVVATMPKGSSSLIGVTEFTNAQTMFPYEEGNDYTFGRVYIVKGNDNGRTYAKWFRKDGAKECIAKIDVNTNSIIGWQQKSTKGLVTNAQNFKIDLTKNNAYWYGMFTFSFVYGTTPCEITVTITDSVYYTITKGQNVISAITYTQDGANYTIGIDLTAKIYGTQVVDMPTEFGVVNSFTAETYEGATTATISTIYEEPIILRYNMAETFSYPKYGITHNNTITEVVRAIGNYYASKYDNQNITVQVILSTNYNSNTFNKSLPCNGRSSITTITYMPYKFASRVKIETMNTHTGETYLGSLNDSETDDIVWKQIATKSTYNSIAELNKAKGTNIELVNGEDNTKKIVDTLSVGEQFISFYHNNANQNRFGIDVSYGNLIHELRITKCLDADLTANYATVTAFMNTGCVMSRIYYKTYSTDWSSTKDYVESLT